MEDRYLLFEESLSRLKKEYEQYQTLYIAFDFDNTLFDYHNIGDTFPTLENLLKQCKEKGMSLILFTANEGTKLEQAVDYCTKRGYKPDYVNESPIMDTRKPFYNLLLDDRAGLGEACKLLQEIIKT